jgi:outer membrane protein assembly factor BamB
MPDGTTKNVVFVATEHNQVYAFDADNLTPDPDGTPPGKSAAQIWQTDEGVLGTPVLSQQLSVDLGQSANRCVDMTTEIGITSTPVIDLKADPAQSVIYVVAKSRTTPGPKYSFTLYKLKLQTGQVLAHQTIEGHVDGKAEDAKHGKLTFEPRRHMNRPGLLLDRGLVYVAFSGHCDLPPYHGWFFAYDAATLARRAIYVATPDGEEAGIWMSGQGPAVDGAGDVYLVTGNGTYDSSGGVLKESGESVVKLNLAPGADHFTVVDWFSPMDRDTLTFHDADLGSAGVVLLTDGHQLLAGGKDGFLFLVDTDAMGKGLVDPPSVVATRTPVRIPTAPSAIDRIRYWNIHGTPIVWDGPQGRLSFVCGEEQPLKAFRLLKPAGSSLWQFESKAPFAFSNETAPYPGSPGMRVGLGDINVKVMMPGAALALSANSASADPAKDAIVWASMPLAQSANQQVVDGVLRAFDASNFVTRADSTRQIVEIWSSDATPNDNVGLHAKFCPPVVADGKVFLPAFNEERIGAGVHELLPGGRRAALVIYSLRH